MTETARFEGPSDQELFGIASEWGTPSFVFDLGVFRRRLTECQQIVGPSVGLCYAMKANPFLIEAAAGCVAKLEVCSPGELTLCEQAGIAPGQIVYSGVNKELTDIAEAIDYQVGVLTAESLLHVEYINQVACEKGLVVDVLLRLNSGSQFGMSREDLLWVVDHRQQFPGINLVGLHYFVYTQRKKLKRQRKELEMLVEFMGLLKTQHGFEVQRLEYGPGLGVPYFPDDDFSDTLAPIKEMAPLLQEIAQGVELTVEMGRFFATSCGTYLTCVKDQKSNEGTNYVILDGGMNHLTYFGQTMGLHVPIITNPSLSQRRGLFGETSCLAEGAAAQEASAPAQEASAPVQEILAPAQEAQTEWCLCGSLCTVNDVLVRSVSLEDLQRGDVLAFHNTGAYSVTEGVYLFLSRTMPRILLREEDGRIILARDFTESSRFNGRFGCL